MTLHNYSYPYILRHLTVFYWPFVGEQQNSAKYEQGGSFHQAECFD
jgi:hypothetical protein